jgi:hypothetical protein
MSFPAVSRSLASPVSSDKIDLAQIFHSEHTWELHRSLRAQGAEREERWGLGGEGILLDRFSLADACCCFLRLVAVQERAVCFELPGPYRIQSCPGGGWIIEPEAPKNCFYWIPQPAMARAVSKVGHLSSEQPGQVSTLKLAGTSLSIELSIRAGFYSDVVVWQIPFEEKELVQELIQLTSLETQAFFLWGSHTTYRKPADLYLHLIFGHVYECRFAWPHSRRICSENDAHSLYVTFNGLERATGKKIYALFKQQLLLSVMARQGGDGGWRHGEWTEDMEAHLRLNASAIHLLLDSLEECQDAAVRQALERAVEFVSRHKDETSIGAWLLHDSLELNEAGMRKSPFRWLPSRVLGKSTSNMLVLNTHLDSLVALDRYQQVTGDQRHRSLIQSAKSAARAVLSLRSLDWVYGMIFKLISLTLLPTRTQERLPLPLRVLKRFAWQWLGPNLYRLTARFPRLVMPGGYIERAIAIHGMADAYHSVNVMDLVRYWRRFPDENLANLLHNAVGFIQENSIQEHWGEKDEKQYALGFWAETLYHLYLLAPDRETLSYLAETILKLDELEIGLPPSLLGGNAEAVAVKDQIGCVSLADEHLRVANLSHEGHAEFLIVNPTVASRPVIWENRPPESLIWQTSTGQRSAGEKSTEVSARGWVLARAGAVSA